MSYAVGVLVALITGVMLRLAGFDRDRSLYPTLLIVTASYYLLFAVMGGSTHALLIEVAAVGVFAAVAVVGFKSNLWLVAIALAGHGAFDLVHHWIVSDPGVPIWWPSFCLAFDVPFAVILAWLLRSHRLGARIQMSGR